MKKIFFLFLLLFLPFTVYAQERSYYYRTIVADIVVLPNTTLSISETQTFSFTGEYHQAWRTIPHKKIDTITDITVFDVTQNKPLIYSPKQLEKTDASSWDKYTTYVKDNTTYIEWYYDANNIQRTWTLQYTVHGAIEFLNDADRLYWNIFTDYDVPVYNAQANIHLPTDVSLSETKNNAYGSQHFVTSVGDYITYTGDYFNPHEPFTIDTTFPKGHIDRSLYWEWFLKRNLGYILSIITILITAIAIYIFWLRHEKFPKGRNTIIPLYKPPHNLPPAIAEVVAYERISPKGLTATVVDLAVRGYVRIQEEKASYFHFGTLVTYIYIGIIVYSIIHTKNWNVILIFLLLFILIRAGINYFSTMKNYTLELTKTDFSALNEYEKKYLDFLFEGNEIISTKSLKLRRGSQYATQFKKIKEEIIKHADSNKKFFDVDLKKEEIKIIFIFILIFGVFYLYSFIHSLITPILSFFITVPLCVLTYYIFTRYEARLSNHGRILRDDWLGFKMYLETAEKYNLQRLTPTLFETYLPYAMVFGVEKKWASAFAAMALTAPVWYSGGHVFSSGTGGSSSFSATGFSASFASSFSSSFSSSGGGGSSGGGSGGGGGGGGGGGAG